MIVIPGVAADVPSAVGVEKGVSETGEVVPVTIGVGERFTVAGMLVAVLVDRSTTIGSAAGSGVTVHAAKSKRAANRIKACFLNIVYLQFHRKRKSELCPEAAGKTVNSRSKRVG